MPVHDWSKVDDGTFHAFHVSWITHLSEALNDGLLPSGFFALPEQVIAGPMPDVVTLQRGPRLSDQTGQPTGGGLAVADSPPHAAYITTGEMAEVEPYSARANRIVIKHGLGDVVAVVEIVSPGNKSSEQRFRSLLAKARTLLEEGIHLLVIDLFPPTRRDPQGIHKAIWDTMCEEAFRLPEGKPLTVAAYYAGEPKKAYVDPIGVGDRLPSSPLFLNAELYVPVPLEATYQETWQRLPEVVRQLVESGS